jgi:polysaccharide pyruvyl transferase WcaK-like protein
MKGKIVVGEFGAFDMENYGDLVYPVLFARMFEQRNKMAAIRRFSFLGSESLQDSGYNSEPVQQLFTSRNRPLHTLVVGGGDVLRTDWNLVASHYHSSSLPRKHRTLRIILRQLGLKYLNPRLDDAEAFRSLHMNYPAAGPFIIKPGKAAKSVAYCSCGVPFTFDDDVKQQVSDAINKAIFVYVRDQQSRETLIQAGVIREIHVAPDLVMALSDYFDPATERQKGRAILQREGVDVQKQVLCVQSNPQPQENRAEVCAQLLAYKKRTDCEVVLLPLGKCHGDIEYLEGLAQISGGEFKCPNLDSIFDLIAVMAACDIFIGTSMHGNITALSFGIPLLFGPIAVRKSEGFLDVVDLPRELKLNSWAELNQKLDLVTGLGGKYFAAKATAAKQRVHQVFDRLVQAVASK